MIDVPTVELLLAAGCALSLYLAVRAYRAGHPPLIHLLLPWLGPIGILCSAFQTRHRRFPDRIFSLARLHSQFGDFYRVEGLPDGFPMAIDEINRVQIAQRISEGRFRLLTQCVLSVIVGGLMTGPGFETCLDARMGRTVNPCLELCGASYVAWAIGYLVVLMLERLDGYLHLQAFERGRAVLLFGGCFWVATVVIVSVGSWLSTHCYSGLVGNLG